MYHAQITVVAKGDGREVGFHDGGCFLKFLKREQINNQTFIAFLNWDWVQGKVRVSLGNYINVRLLIRSRFKNLEKQLPS